MSWLPAPVRGDGTPGRGLTPDVAGIVSIVQGGGGGSDRAHFPRYLRAIRRVWINRHRRVHGVTPIGECRKSKEVWPFFGRGA